MRQTEDILKDIASINRARKSAVQLQVWCVGRLAELDRELKGAKRNEGLRQKENAPAGAATPEQGASEKCHLQYSTGGENVKLSNHHYQPGAGKY